MIDTINKSSTRLTEANKLSAHCGSVASAWKLGSCFSRHIVLLRCPKISTFINGAKVSKRKTSRSGICRVFWTRGVGCVSPSLRPDEHGVAPFPERVGRLAETMYLYLILIWTRAVASPGVKVGQKLVRLTRVGQKRKKTRRQKKNVTVH